MLSDTDLERSLRDTVVRIWDSGDHENLTVKRVRARVEQELSLAQDFFKQPEWKTRSKAIIEGEALKHRPAEPIPSIESAKPVETNSPKRFSISSSHKANATSRKRKTPEKSGDNTDSAGRRITKRSRHVATVISDDDEEEEEEEEEQEEEEENRARPTSASSAARLNGTQSSTSMAKQSNTKSTAKASSAATGPMLNDLSDGDLSEVFDDGPVSKRKAQTHTQKPPAATKKSTKSAKSKVADPETEEIKKLQRQLVDCGIRKVWGKELKPFERPRDKIKHLKKMLIDAGMTGRFSKEKAASIREARELAADLEAVQEGAKLWGKDRDASQRRVNKTVRPTTSDFLDDNMMED